jgi:putative hemolysin
VFEAVRRSHPTGSPNAVSRMLEFLGVDYRVPAEELERIPKSGPVVVTANHPYGLLDGAILACILTKVRSSVKVDVGALRESAAWLRRGGLLATLPAVKWRTSVFAMARR